MRSPAPQPRGLSGWIHAVLLAIVTFLDRAGTVFWLIAIPAALLAVVAQLLFGVFG